MRNKINKCISIEQIILLLFLFITPYFGKTLDYTEALIFYSIPPLISLSLLFNKTSKNTTGHPFVYLIPLYFISTIFSKNPGTSYYSFFTFLTVLLTLILTINLIPLKKFNLLLIVSSLFYSSIFIFHKLNILNLNHKAFGDNFILQIWGHSYLADLIILSIPILILKLKPKKLFFTFNFLLLTFLTLLLTQSRSATLALFIGLLFLKSTSKPQRTIKISILSITTIFLIIHSILIFQNKIPQKNLTGNRFIYWQQAISAFSNKPLFGNGPNTFSYINKKHQKEPNTNSNLAHNSFLTFLSENGIFFTLLFFFLIIKQLIILKKTNNLYFCLATITLVNSLLDPSWSSPGIFIISLYIFFSSLKKSTCQKTKRKRNPPLLLPIIILLFLSSKTLSDCLYLKSKHSQSLIADPFNLNSHLALIKKNQLHPLTLKLFPNDTIIYKELIHTIPLPQSEPYYYKLFELNPKENPALYLKLLNYYHQKQLSQKQDQLTSLIFKNLQFNTIDYLQKTKILKPIYHQAINNFPNTPQKTISLLEKLTIHFPKEGHFHIDLANAYWHTDQKEKAFRQLNTCLNFQSPYQQCQSYLKFHQQSPTPNFNLPGSSEFINYIDNKFGN